MNDVQSQKNSENSYFGDEEENMELDQNKNPIDPQYIMDTVNKEIKYVVENSKDLSYSNSNSKISTKQVVFLKTLWHNVFAPLYSFLGGKRMFKKIISLLLAVMMIMSLVTVMATSTGAVEYENTKLYFDVNGTGWEMGAKDKVGFYIKRDLSRRFVIPY